MAHIPTSRFIKKNAVIDSFEPGIPLGNLSSQVFANIYLHEWDRFVRHTFKPKAYLRYGDDFMLFSTCKEDLYEFRVEGAKFLRQKLAMSLNKQSEKIGKVKWGLPFLGRKIYTKVAMLTTPLPNNMGAAWALIRSQAKSQTREKLMSRFSWNLLYSATGTL